MERWFMRKLTLFPLKDFVTLRVYLQWGSWPLCRGPRSPVLLTFTILDSMCLEQRPTSSPGNSLLRGLSVWCSMMNDIPASAYTMSVAIPPTPPTL